VEIVEIRCRTVLRALDTLKESIDHANEGSSTKFSKNLNNGLIQCFEYSIEEVWKLYGLYLQEIMSVNLGKPRSKDVLKASLRYFLISQQEYEYLLVCVEDRNQCSHGYNFFIAANILPRIPEHYEVMKSVVDRLHTQIMNNTK
jgi:hypothetical protein